MEQELGRPMPQYVLSDETGTVERLTAKLKEDGVDVAVMLGRSGYSAAKSVSRVLPVVVGAVLVPEGDDSQGLSGVSLNPDPDIVFGSLQALVPDAKDVTVIYDPNQKSADIARARDVAQARGLVLHALPATDLRLSAAAYRKVLLDISSTSSAIWLPHGNAAIDERALLPEVLRESWDKGFVVFSSSIDDVRKGALFSLYPDTSSMGRRLMVMARERAQGSLPGSEGIEPLRDVLIALNRRTAEHLGLSFSPSAMKRVGMVFPVRP